MLDKTMKKEMLEDARNIQRRNAFRAVSCINAVPQGSFNDYLHFLHQQNEIFPSEPVSRKITPTHKNLL